MTTAALAGYGGSVSVCTEVKNWRADIEIDSLDATSMVSGGWKKYVAGLEGVTFSATCQGSVLVSRTAAACTLKTATSGGASISGTAFIRRVSVNDPVDGVVTFDVDGVFTGSVSVS